MTIQTELEKLHYFIEACRTLVNFLPSEAKSALFYKVCDISAVDEDLETGLQLVIHHKNKEIIINYEQDSNDYKITKIDDMKIVTENTNNINTNELITWLLGEIPKVKPLPPEWEGRWSSICSVHGKYRKDCNMCNTGIWIHGGFNKLSNWLFKNDPDLWRKWANTADAEGKEFIESTFPNLKMRG